MKLKKFLAGMLTAAMVLTSVPMAGLGGITAQAAGEEALSAPQLAVTVPAAGAEVTDSSIKDATTEYEYLFKDIANSNTRFGKKDNRGENVVVGTDVTILSEEDVEDAFQGKFAVIGNTNAEPSGTNPFLIKFKMKIDVFGGQHGIIGMMDKQFGVQLDNRKLAFYACCSKTNPNGSWVEVGVDIPNTAEWTSGQWIEVIAYYGSTTVTSSNGNSLGNLLNIWVKNPAGTVIHGRHTSTYGNQQIEIQNWKDETAGTNIFTVGYNSENTTGKDYAGKLAGVKMYQGANLPAITNQTTITEATRANTNTTPTDEEIAANVYAELERELENLTPVLNIKAAKVLRDHYKVGASTWTTEDGKEFTGNFEARKPYKVTATLTADTGYVFTEASKVTAIPVGVDAVDSVVSEDGTTMTVTYTLEANQYYKAYEYWEKERIAETLADQQDSDIWHYQICKNNIWSDLPYNAYNSSKTFDDGSYGAWCEDLTPTGAIWGRYDKISQYQITASDNNMAWLWKSFGKGYYSVTLEKPIGEGATNQNSSISLNVNHVDVKNNVIQLMEKTQLRHGGNFTTKIAKMGAEEVIRIATGDHGTGIWALNVRPVIVERTAKEYAVQYLADLADQNINPDDYTTATATAYTTAKTDLEVAIAEGAQDTEEQITAKIEALETAKANLTKKPQIKNTSVSLGGKIGLTFYTDLTSLDGVTASFTVDGKEVEATPELINGVVACTYESAAKNMTDMVSVSITVNGDTITSPETSVSKNAQWLLSNSPDDATLNALLKAMLNYGAAAQKQFDYKSGDDSNLANAVLEPNDKQVPEIGNGLDGTCVNMGVTAEGYRGISLVLKSGTAMKLYVAGHASIVLKKTDAQDTAATSTGELNNGFSFVTLENIAANHLQDEYTVEINNNSAGKVSPLYYCYLVSKEVNPDPDLKNLVNALYDYNQKALAYEKAHSQH